MERNCSLLRPGGRGADGNGLVVEITKGAIFAPSVFVKIPNREFNAAFGAFDAKS